eukprot:gene342-10795_t
MPVAEHAPTAPVGCPVCALRGCPACRAPAGCPTCHAPYGASATKRDPGADAMAALVNVHMVSMLMQHRAQRPLPTVASAPPPSPGHKFVSAFPCSRSVTPHEAVTGAGVWKLAADVRRCRLNLAATRSGSEPPLRGGLDRLRERVGGLEARLDHSSPHLRSPHSSPRRRGVPSPPSRDVGDMSAGSAPTNESGWGRDPTCASPADGDDDAWPGGG